jgi:hypothetical protein
MEINMMEIGEIIQYMEKESTLTTMEIFMKEIL